MDLPCALVCPLMAYIEDAAHWAYYDNTGSTLPPPPPPPVGVELNRQQIRRDWNELGDEASLETEVVTQTAAGQPSNADYLATINKALQIIELHCQKPRMISLDAMVPAPASVAPPSVPTPVSVELTNTSSENNDILKKQVATLQATVCQSEERIAILENHITRISGTVCDDGTDHDFIILGISQLEDRILEDTMKIEERLTSLEKAATSGPKPEEFYIGADVGSCAAALDAVDEEECFAGPGLEDIAATAALADNRDTFCEPFTATQAREFNRFFFQIILLWFY